VRIRHSAIGLNHVDTCHRRGSCPIAIPCGLGIEAAGVVEEIGSGVTHVCVGDRVAYAGGAPGAYAESRLMSADPLVRLPDHVSDQQGAAIMLKGMTAEYLVHRAYQVRPGDTVVVHAATGGVGLILCQWLNYLGATVIGTVRTEGKAAIARRFGCHHTVLHRSESLRERVKDLTGGRGVPVVYDCLGAAAWGASLDCLADRGTLVSFGDVSGPVTDNDIRQLALGGSLYVTRPLLAAYISDRAELEKTAAHVFDALSSGVFKAHIGQVYDLRDAAIAHLARDESRTVGSTILIP
jgi:NADPH2:quinone reductase